MEVLIEKLQESDAEDLYKFELENRKFFEETVPTRGDDYYEPEVFKIRHETLLEEQADEISYFYLIKDENGNILGRMNLVDIDGIHKIAHLGYRVGRLYTGKGVAKQALELLLETVVERDIKQVKAKTTTTNIASQKVLEKNGFKQMACEDEEYEVNGQRVTFIYYIWNRQV
ncbi:GNAT family N-acetyltransferase [Sporosarcina aquimarina]|uniref:GNAT family N-acetyltransferase n=1 Tax=Sporosarcina aquimarina TaxID=114975 RepID=UPI00203BC15C|nr:GNAT family N-acetyltransferase [Sporosarcina aquimarina]MCM3757290.1 GNAT family N-acetyltransferase [Sporosarcina aquimarina]